MYLDNTTTCVGHLFAQTASDDAKRSQAYADVLAKSRTNSGQIVAESPTGARSPAPSVTSKARPSSGVHRGFSSAPTLEPLSFTLCKSENRRFGSLRLTQYLL